jgi:PKD repeat protein
MIEDLRGCRDTVTQQICVPPALTVDYTSTLSCFGDPVSFTPMMITPQATADSLITFHWNFGDPATGSNNVSATKKPAHTFSKVGFYTVNFTTTDKFGCSASQFKTVEVKALPVAGFSYTPGQCDSTVTFSSTSVDTSSAISTYIWQYGDGTSDTITAPTATTTHKYLVPKEYTVTLTILNDNGCRGTYSALVTRSACIVASAGLSTDTLCQGYLLVFADRSTCNGTISQWKWNFGDGTLLNYSAYQPVVSHAFANPGAYTVKLKVSTVVGASTISDSTSMNILVKPTPVAGFTTQAVCLGEKTMFTDTTHANGAAALFFHWDFGETGRADTSNLRNPVYLYTVPGMYASELSVKNQFGCADTATAEVWVNGLPTASYANSLACAGQQTYFFDASQPFAAPVTSWGWRVNDTLGFLGSMQGATPSFVFDSTGNYQVMLTVADTNSCVDTLVQQVKVSASPHSAFSYSDNVDEIQGQMQFTNASAGATQHYWDFGDGTFSYAESPKMTYTEDGNYQVMLVSMSTLGCKDTAIIAYTMMFKGLYVPNAFAPGGSIQATRYWKPAGVNLASYRADIYDSHGFLLWRSSLLDEAGSPVESWDGTFKEKPCQQDVYVWKITAIFRDGTIWYNTDIGSHKGLTQETWGTITLIR